MLPRTNLQRWKYERSDTLQEVLADFQQNLCDIVQQSVKSAMRMLLQLNQQQLICHNMVICVLTKKLKDSNKFLLTAKDEQ